MPAVIRVSAVYTMSDQVSPKLTKMANKVAALEANMNKVNGQFDKLATNAKKADDPLKGVNKQLGDMKKTIGTEKGTSGLLSRVTRLQQKLGKLSPKGGYTIKVSTTGIKSSERELNRLQTKAAEIGAQKYRIKIEVDKDTVNLLREQAGALDAVGRSLQNVKSGFRDLRDGEAQLRKTMTAKTAAVDKQRSSMQMVERQFTRTTRETNLFRKAAREGAFETKSLTQFLIGMNRETRNAGGMFRRGVTMGYPFVRMLPMIAVGANVAAVALGGLLSMVHGLIAPVLSVVSSLTQMVGVVGLLPAAYAAAGAAAGSFAGAMNAFFGDALKNGAKLAQIERQLVTATGEQRTTLLEQQKKILGEMNSQQQDLANGVADLSKSWREVFTSNEKLQKRFYNTANMGLKTGQKLLKRYRGDLQQTADAVRMIVHRFIQVLDTNKDLNKGIKSVFRISRALSGNIQRSIEPLMAFFGRVLQASEGPMKRIGNNFERWAQSLNKVRTKSIERFFTRGLDSAGQWWKILKNIAGAFSNIFRAGSKETGDLMEDLVLITGQFKQWTGGKGFKLIRREFKVGMKVARAFGRVLKSFTYEFMKLGADGDVGKSVVDFLDMIADGMPTAFNFMRNALKEVGPSITDWIDSLGGMVEMWDGVAKAVAAVFDLMTLLNNLMSKMPDWMKQALGIALGLKIISGGLGVMFGGVFGIMTGVYNQGQQVLGMLKKVAAAAKTTALVDVASSAAMGGAPVPIPGRGSGAPRAGVDVNTRQGFGGADAAWTGAMAADALPRGQAAPGGGGATRRQRAGAAMRRTGSRARGAAGLGMTAVGLGGVGKTKGGKAAGAAGKGLGKAGALLTFAPIVKTFKVLGSAAKLLGGKMRGLLAIFQGMSKLARFTIIGTVIFAVVDGLVALATNFAGIRTEMGLFFDDVGGRFKEALSGLSKALGLGALGSDEFKQKMADVSLFLKSMGVAVVKVFKGAMSFVSSVALFLIDTITNIVNFIKGIASGLGQIFGGIIEMFKGNFIKGIKMVLQGIWTLITNLLKFLWNLVKSIFTRLGEFISDTFGTFGKKVVAVFDWVADNIKSVFSKVVNAIIDMVNKIPKVDIDHVGGGGKVQGLGSRFDEIDEKAAQRQATIDAADPANQVGPPAKTPKPGDAGFIGPVAPGTAKKKKGGGGGGGGAGGVSMPEMDSMASVAGAGNFGKGLVVKYEPTALAQFQKDAGKVKQSLQSIVKMLKPFWLSKPLKVAMMNGVKVIQSVGKQMLTEMESLGSRLTSSVEKWAGAVSKALNSMNPGITVADVAAALGLGGSSDTQAEKKAGGGVVGGDTRKGDSVHALLKPGEVVLNEGQQRKLGMANVKKSLSGPGTAAKGTFGYANHSAMNMTGAPASSMRYASGGTVPELKPYMDAAVKLGGIITSTTGGKHATNSQHYTGHAFDVDGGSGVNMKIFRAFEPDAKARKVTELFFDPAGGYRDGSSIGPIGGHGDHVHAGIRGGAGGAASIGGAAVTLPKPPNLGLTKFGQAAQSPVNMMHGALQAAVNHKAGGMDDFGSFAAVGSNQEIGQQMAEQMYGWVGAEWAALKELWTRESNWNNTIANPSSGAYGIPQALPPTKMPFAAQAAGGSSPSAQIGWGLNYIKGRYTTPSGAIAHHNAHNWYGMGGSGIADKPQLIGVGDKPEHVQITPAGTSATPGNIMRGPGSGGSGTNVTNNFYIGTLAGDRESLNELAAMVGDVIADTVDGASRTYVSGSSEVMTGNG